jgi:transposase
MTKKDLNNWIMYHELHRFHRLGFSNAKIAQFLVVDIRTVRKYLNMTEREYEHYLLQLCQRKKILSRYENFVSEKLSLFQDTSTAQIHDWLKEAHNDFPEVTPRTVYNFVMFVRQKYNIPFIRSIRDYFPIEELPYGEQAQVDFGEYNMRTPSGQKKKVKFFAMVLSRSRMKFIWFLDKPFTSQTVSQAHENAFAFFGGIPKTLVYDQDRTMVVDENLGDIILTSTFKQYTKSRSFNLHFCRKADPESKGKVENVVQYVKKNFLYNRLYSDIQTLNSEAIAWLDRTANHLPHNLTKISPKNAFMNEKSHLKPFTPLTIEINEIKTYIVRKNNTVNYRSNFYTVPMGTYKAEETIVIIKEKENTLEILSIDNELICTHILSPETGKIISNTSHRRDTSKTLEDMMWQVADYFTDQSLAMSYLQQIREKLPRYTRDHLQVILKALQNVSKETADKTLNFCLKNSLLNGHEWTQVLQVFLDVPFTKTNNHEIILLDKNNIEKANQTPQASSIDDYENIINPVCR